MHKNAVEKGLPTESIGLSLELANQITDSIKKYSRYLKMNSVTITGGMSYTLQNRLLSKPIDILIATPGRLLDLYQQKKIDIK